MIYVELLRAYRVLLVYLALVAALAIVAVLGVLQLRGHIHVGPVTSLHGIPVASLIVGAVYCALAVPIVLGNTLGRENLTLPIAWTRPVARGRIALGFVAVDLAAIVLAAACAFLALIAILAAAGLLGYLRTGASVAGAAIAGIGMLFMWYALLQACTAPLSGGGGGAVRGLSAVVFLVLGALYGLHLPQPLHGVIAALNVLNPFAWYSGSSSSQPGVHLAVGSPAAAGSGVVHRFFTAVPEPLAIVAPWIIGALVTALAIRLWAQHEATR